MPNGNDNRIVIHCECGAKLKVPAAAAGKKGRCPECKTIVTIPVPQEAPSEDSGGPISLAPGLDDDSLLDELAAQAQSAPQAAPPVGAKTSQPCPACKSAIPEGAALCVSCGHNLLTGKTTKAASARKADVAAATRRFALGAGTFAFGCALSFAGAMVGAILWSIVSVITEYEIGYIAWGLGVLAGGGMVMGYRTGNLQAGVAAAVIAIVGIVAAKATVFVYLSYPELQQMQHIADAMSDEHVEDRARLAEHRMGLRTRRMGLSYFDDRNEEIYDEEFYNVVKLNDADLIEQVEQLDAWEAGGRWSDADFVRGYLIYDHIDKEIQTETEKTDSDSDAEPWEPSPSDWRRLHDSARQTVDGLADEDRMLQAREIERDRKRNMQSMQLAFHQFRIDNIDNLSAASDGSVEELQTHFRSMSEKDRKAALAELAAWNRGAKWDDVEYVRSAAINERIEKAIQERNEATEDQDAEWWVPSQEERNVLRDEAAQVVDALPHDRRVDQIKSEKAKQKARFEELRRNNSKAISDEITGEAFTFFVQNYFGAMDLLFAVLAIGSAFKIAAGGGSDD